MSDTTYKSRVEKGARWLDEVFPGWEDHIDRKTLRLSESSDCICGQVFKDEGAKLRTKLTGFGYASQHLFSEANSWITALVGLDPVPRTSRGVRKHERIDAVAVALGFDVDWEGAQTYSGLQNAWVRLLNDRAKARK